MIEEAYFSQRALAERLGVDEKTIRAQVRAGKLTVVHVGSRVVIPRSAAEAFVERQTTAANVSAAGAPCRSTPGGKCLCFCHPLRRAVQSPRRAPTRRDAWTPAQDAHITELARRGCTPAHIAAAVSERFPETPRTMDATRRRIVQLGVSLREGWWSRLDLIRRLGVSEAKMKRAEAQGLLSAEPYGQWRRISHAEAERFVRAQAGLLVEPKRVRDPQLRAVAETAAIVNRRKQASA